MTQWIKALAAKADALIHTAEGDTDVTVLSLTCTHSVRMPHTKKTE